MNERIKELAEQAGIEFTYDPTETPVRAFAECWEDELAKFAELIVGHAIECVRDVLRDENSDLSYDAASQVQNRIREYFGLNE
jgi:hypothetical protein